MKRMTLLMLVVAGFGLAACDEENDIQPVSGATSAVTPAVQATPIPPTLGVDCLVDPPQGVVPHSVDFRTSAYGGVVPDNYVWNFGDGTTGSGLETKHTYNSPGLFTARVTASSGSFAASCTVPVQVASSLVAVCRATPPSGPAPLTTRLAAKPLFCRDGCQWRWDFGDGQTLVSDTEDNPAHEYLRAGTYHAEGVIVTDRGRIKDSCNLKITVQ